MSQWVIPEAGNGCPESIIPVVVMDSGLALRAPRNDDREKQDAAPSPNRARPPHADPDPPTTIFSFSF